MKVAQVEKLQEKLSQTNEKVTRLEDEVEQLKLKVAKARDIGVAKFKELVSY